MQIEKLSSLLGKYEKEGKKSNQGTIGEPDNVDVMDHCYISNFHFPDRKDLRKGTS